ncbi:hypothetical protein [Dysgonomonas sp. 511]|uniref:hypothetical protein n=1 Tax=Dysgonomonas sp. 511 TaxID=2302930 RepID=UPI0016290672|nr:hypothetical protein [Dysgonomonas sp. 511]
MALPKRKQKASASFLGDLSSVCRQKGINGLRPIPFYAAFTGQIPACGTDARKADARLELA